MTSLLKLMLILALGFATTFIIIKLTGLISTTDIQNWLEHCQTISPLYTGAVIIMLLLVDLFIAIPTLTVIILSGYLLGHTLGSIVSIIGLLTAGTIGYWLSYRYDIRIMNIILKDENERKNSKSLFKQHGLIMIILSRAVPILPEVTACMAGLTKMSYWKFLSGWLISVVPYAIIASYAGSISTVENPMPAIITAISLTLCFSLGWIIFKKLKLSQTKMA